MQIWLSAQHASDLLQSLYDLCEGWSTLRLHMPALANELQNSLVVAIGNA